MLRCLPRSRREAPDEQEARSRQSFAGARSAHGNAAGTPSIALALGGGGARGLAHIPVLEAFDELGLRPKIIAGTSIGAIFAAAYASGLSGKQIRAHAYEVLKKRLDLVRDLYAARVRTPGGIFNALTPRPAFLAPERLLDIILPPQIARDFDSSDDPAEDRRLRLLRAGGGGVLLGPAAPGHRRQHGAARASSSRCRSTAAC